MKNNSLFGDVLRRLLTLAVFSGAFFIFARSADAQRRDYLTDSEIELVRDAQEIDSRVSVLTKAIDRRFSVLGIIIPNGGIPPKEGDKWGPAPTGTRLELFLDIKRLLQKAVDDVDDVAAHRTAEPVKPSSPSEEKDRKRQLARFPNAVHLLASSAANYRAALGSVVDKSTDDKERGPVLDSIDLCDQIIAAAANLPKADITEKKKKSDKN
jgi:hypothetical protein